MGWIYIFFINTVDLVDEETENHLIITQYRFMLSFITFQEMDLYVLMLSFTLEEEPKNPLWW